ncbi:hypothetical protein ACFQAS_01985 [Halopenitus salinus]|uniref:ATP-dependent helicase/nuclease subunit B n=1 Tax=Halopenitus salinus TaxID=1198295 RepID=A0ABD5UR09_9EURY
MTASDRFTLTRPIDPPETPTVEIVSSTQREEARSAMAVVAALCDQDVSIRDVAVVVRDLDPYEEPLFRAAIQYGLTPVFWTQLRVTRTRPYALVDAVCETLSESSIELDTLLRPLELGWSPTGEVSDTWPIDPATVSKAIRRLPRESRTTRGWKDVIEASGDVDDRIWKYVDWVSAAPDPEPGLVRELLSDVIEGYAEHGLPETKATDSPALLDTETDARAVVRIRTLVEQLSHKYADRLDKKTVEQSWDDVAELASVIVTQRPGRREHSNARAVDVLEANDVWALDVPYVVALGLTAERWPQPPESVLPPEFREAVFRGEGRSRLLAPQPAWAGGRDRDQFVDTLRAASRCAVVMRHTRTTDGEDVPRSPFLEYLDNEHVSEASRSQLVGTDRDLPPELQRYLTGEVK